MKTKSYLSTRPMLPPSWVRTAGPRVQISQVKEFDDEEEDDEEDEEEVGRCRGGVDTRLST